MIETKNRILLAVLMLTALAAATGSMAFGAEGKVNINEAGIEELSLLPRVGPAVAARIIEFRETNGAFEAAEDLMLVKGIGERTYELIEPHVTLSGETTLAEKVSVPRKPKTESEGGE